MKKCTYSEIERVRVENFEVLLGDLTHPTENFGYRLVQLEHSAAFTHGLQHVELVVALLGRGTDRFLHENGKLVR